MDVVDVVGRVVVGFVEQFFEHGQRWVGLQCSDQGGNPRDGGGQIRQNILAVDGTKMGGGGGRLKGAETHGNWRGGGRRLFYTELRTWVHYFLKGYT